MTLIERIQTMWMIVSLTVGLFLFFAYDLCLSGQRLYYGSHYNRLQELKKKYDLKDIFKFPTLRDLAANTKTSQLSGWTEIQPYSIVPQTERYSVDTLKAIVAEKCSVSVSEGISISANPASVGSSSNSRSQSKQRQT